MTPVNAPWREGSEFFNRIQRKQSVDPILATRGLGHFTDIHLRRVPTPTAERTHVPVGGRAAFVRPVRTPRRSGRASRACATKQHWCDHARRFAAASAAKTPSVLREPCLANSCGYAKSSRVQRRRSYGEGARCPGFREAHVDEAETANLACGEWIALPFLASYPPSARPPCCGSTALE